MNKAEQLIACLEGEIAKRDEELAACRVAVENCEVFLARIAELEAKYLELASLSSRVSVELPIAYAAPVPDAKAQGVVMPERKPWRTLGHAVKFHAQGWNECLDEVARLNAAPAAPAADAGIVDMYRHLQKVTPYRFKKIQDASITDGGDVMYFHKDRFDAALLADMAAHRAKGVV